MHVGDYTSNSVALALDLAEFGAGRTDLARLVAAQREMLIDHGYPVDVPATEAEALRHTGLEIAGVLGIADEPRFITELARLLDERDARPTLTTHDGQPHVHFARDGAPVSEWLATIAVAGLVMHVCRYGRDRLRSCSATDCGRWYADNSRNRSRRYCSSACASRTTVGAFRARQK